MDGSPRCIAAAVILAALHERSLRKPGTDTIDSARLQSPFDRAFAIADVTRVELDEVPLPSDR